MSLKQTHKFKKKGKIYKIQGKGEKYIKAVDTVNKKSQKFELREQKITTITCGCSFVTFGGSLIYFSHLMVPLLHSTLSILVANPCDARAR